MRKKRTKREFPKHKSLNKTTFFSIIFVCVCGCVYVDLISCWEFAQLKHKRIKHIIIEPEKSDCMLSKAMTLYMIFNGVVSMEHFPGKIRYSIYLLFISMLGLMDTLLLSTTDTAG